ncbi:glycosyltransferase involved in cell wall biosynthesis [Amnibacterium kyonggiense]|uniref:D-inositol 3-phosphate glycosyltransferase n=1 Tax=Amnibacterium kyonggiense TaxID=595671 RepID=A0A4R7FMA3_9MICO|nr:glycosyltransferase involved in cell wall biosynthesis [Amnibacterium kyonggiense]
MLMGGDTFAPDVNGAASFQVRLASGIASRGHDVHIIAQAPKGVKQGTYREEHLGQMLTVHRLNSFRWPLHDWLRAVYPWRIHHNAARIIDEVRPDVSHMNSHMLIGRGITTESYKRGIRIIATNHFMPENLIEHTPFPKFTWPLITWLAWKDCTRLYRKAAALTTPTKRAAAYLEARTGLRNVHAISCGIRMSDYTPDFEAKPDNRIVFVGRITGEKMLPDLVEAVARIPRELDAQLDLVGEGDIKRQLEQQAQRLGIADRVHFPGRVSDEDLRTILTRATVFAMPSTAELQSIATMEAMASGLPVVAADAMALPHLVKDGENGYLFPPRDIDALADRLTRVLSMPQDEREVMQRASLRLLEPHDIDTTITIFERLYRGEEVTDPETDVPPLSAKVREQFRSLAKRAKSAITD